MDKYITQDDELLAFLNKIPVAIARVAINGDVIMLTQKAVALLMGIASHGMIDNIFHILDPVAPEIHRLVDRFSGEYGVVCEELTVTLEGCKGNFSRLILEVSIQKVEINELMFVFTDVTGQKLVEAERAALAAIVESSDDAIIAKTLEGTITSWNVGAERMYGYCRDEAIGKPISLVIPELQRNEETMFMVQIRNGCSINHFDTLRLRKDGSVIDVSVSLSPVYNSQGGVIGTSEISHDITDRVTIASALNDKHRELELKQHRLDGIINGTGAGTWEWNIKTGEAVVNEHWAGMFGFTCAELAPITIQTLLDSVHPDDTNSIYEQFNIHVKDPSRPLHNEFRMKHKNGGWVWVSDYGSVTQWDLDGTPLLMQGFHLDITEQKQVSDMLSESERFMRQLIDVLPGMVGYWDQDLRCRFANLTYQEWFGKSPEQMKGIHIRDLMGDELFSQNEPFINAVMQGEPQHFERTLMKADGSTGYAWAHYIPDGVGGNFHGFFALITDITDLKKAEANLTAQDQFYKATLDGIRAHICVLNPQGTIITTNRAWEYFGMQNDAIKEFSSIGSNYFFACQSPAAEQDPAVKEFTTGISAVLEGTSPQFMKEYPCQTPEKDLWFICTANPFSVNGVRYAVISHEDITWRKAAERQLSMLSRVIEQSPVTVVITDTSGTIEFVNPFFVTLTGYSAEEAIGQNPRVLKSGLTPPETYQELWSTIKSGQMWEGEFINRNKKGEINFEYAKVSPMRDEEGVITHYVSIKENINKRKELESSLITAKEKAEIANQAKDEFLAVMSHEMRTPLNGMIGMTDILLESDLTDEQRDFAQIANSCGQDLLRIVSDILDFTQIRINRLTLESKDFNLQRIIHETTDKFITRATDSGIGLSTRIAPAVPCHLKGDAGKVLQILTSLVDNALKFTAKGTVVIAVSCQAVEFGFAIIRFDVHDTGRGIKESVLKGIFSAFSQIDSSSTRCHGGTGLGLALSKELAELLGGEVGVTSEYGKGSTFWFTARLELSQKEQGAESDVCPAERVEPQNAAVIGQPETAVSAPATRILLAEDNTINQKIICNLLKNIGYTADVVPDGAKAVRALEIADYDLVLMDCMMPEMNGYEATTVIRDSSSHVINHKVPIIAVTANAMEGDREMCIGVGMDDYLTKPLKKADLAEMLEKWLPPGKGQYDHQ